LASPRAQTSALDAPSEYPYKWGADDTLVPLKRSPPETNYSDEKTNKPSGWDDDGVLETTMGNVLGDESYRQLPLKRSIPEPNYSYIKKRISFMKKHKAATESDPPAGTISPPMVMPENLGFLWPVDSIEVVYDEKHPPRLLSVSGTKGNGAAKIWSPPNRAKMFKRHPGNLYRWRM
jgi:hypothetical protein